MSDELIMQEQPIQGDPAAVEVAEEVAPAEMIVFAKPIGYADELPAPKKAKKAKKVKAAPQKVEKPKHRAGDIVTLRGTPVYVTATEQRCYVRLSGKYYLYDGVEKNGRYALTNSLMRVNQPTAFLNVIGWIAAELI